ncbi:MAG TPA: phage holin family protein [Gallionella sp.]|nr:phage holin family protein [Gallionella sp.]
MQESPGLLDSARRLFATLLGVVTTRVELLANEWQEERLRLAEMLLFALFSAFCLGVGMVLLTMFLVVLFWDEHRLAVLASLSLFFFVLGAWLIGLLRSRMRQGSRLFSVSLAELNKDRASLGARDE